MGTCFTILVAMFAIAIMIYSFVIGLVILDIIFLLLLIGSIRQASYLKREKPSKMLCSNCKSTNVKLHTRKSGDTISGSHYMYWVNGRHEIQYDRIAKCKDCGFTWHYVTKEDIVAAQKHMSNMACLYGLIFVVLIFVTFGIFA